MLHEMDYQKYISIRHDYILLPEEALTNTTRLRWWQPFVINNGIVVSGSDRAQWALDNVLIGGAEINPSQLVDTFDDGKSQVLITFLTLLVSDLSGSHLHFWKQSANLYFKFLTNINF